MAKTDQPLKRLITLIGREFAAWVLNTDVRAVKLLPSEHTAVVGRCLAHTRRMIGFSPIRCSSIVQTSHFATLGCVSRVV